MVLVRQMSAGTRFGKVVVVAVMLAAGGSESGAQSAPLTAQGLLNQMEATYAAAKTYADTSTARFRNPDQSEGAQVEFRIWFARPKFLRIDATTRATPEAAPLREVMWFDGANARTWTTGSAVMTREKIQLAGSKMFGTYAYHIPTLLDESYAGPRRLNQLNSPALAADETIDGVDCYRVRGDWQGDPYDVWLGKADHLVRKIVADYKGYVMEETHREIAINQPIAPAIFHFAPENEGGAGKKGTPPPRLPGEHVRPK
ncbi:MAG: DUF2092 domain-containing protein [Verrucomicrobiota bacterium]|nr:DUF2092 domain-containing protein [Verrucomicrobiota bacterium]